MVADWARASRPASRATAAPDRTAVPPLRRNRRRLATIRRARLMISLQGFALQRESPGRLSLRHSAVSGISAGLNSLRPGLVSLSGTIATGLRVDVDDCAALDFPLEHPAHDIGNLCKADHLRRPGELAEVQVASETGPSLNTPPAGRSPSRC